MSVRGRITYIGSPAALSREFRPVIKESLQEVGRYWHRNILKKHFGRGAHSRYGYQARKKFYQLKKTRITGQGSPLVFRGDLKRQVLSRRVVTGTSKTARVKIRGPRYLHAYRKDLRQPDKAAELTAANAADQRELARLLERIATGMLNRIKTKETIRV